MGSIRKRRRFFHVTVGVKKKYVESGTSGLLFTCSGNEKQAVREAYNVIEQTMERWRPAAERDDQKRADREQGDVADSIQHFSDQSWFFPSLFGCFHEASAGSRQRERCCRLLQRVWPVESTCRMDLLELDREISRMISRNFHGDGAGKWPTYSFEFKARNNDSLRRSDAMDMVALAMDQLAPAVRVSLDNPEITVVVQVIHKSVMLSCIQQFFQRRKLSLHSKD
ncbi:unnamed protein product [Gongylonema pulchrum]|uniref:THUMP domain-containing protein n=1 Tax=Gongylonema pulchrum TaxID=637853 RepID=A0A183EM96_9BILA|nr:unnamed protein product [Gongylonema pulchrum]